MLVPLTNTVNLPIKLTKPSAGVVNWRWKDGEELVTVRRDQIEALG